MKGRSPLCSAVTPSTVPPRDTRAGHLLTLLLDPFPVCFVHVCTCRQRTQWCRVHLGRVSRVVGLLSLPKCVCETFPAESTELCLVRDAPRILLSLRASCSPPYGVQSGIGKVRAEFPCTGGPAPAPGSAASPVVARALRTLMDSAL